MTTNIRNKIHCELVTSVASFWYEEYIYIWFKKRTGISYVGLELKAFQIVIGSEVRTGGHC